MNALIRRLPLFVAFALHAPAYADEDHAQSPLLELSSVQRAGWVAAESASRSRIRSTNEDSTRFPVSHLSENPILHTACIWDVFVQFGGHLLGRGSTTLSRQLCRHQDKHRVL